MKTEITWHPYPSETPPNRGSYLLTFVWGYDEYVDIRTGSWVIGDNVKSRFIVDGVRMKENDKVIAWAELPKPYEG